MWKSIWFQVLLHGSIVATLFAEGYSVNEIYSIFNNYANKIKYFEYKNIVKLIGGIIFKGEISIMGLSSGSKIEKYIRDFSNKKNFFNITDIKFPLFISSVNLTNGDTYIFTSQKLIKDDKVKYSNKIDIAKAVRASCSYPGIFEPCNINGVEFVDGGIRENIPWRVLKYYGADKIISVSFENNGLKECCKNMLNVIDCSFDYMMQELKEYELYGKTDIIEISTEKINLLDASKVDELYEIGYKAGKEYIRSNLKI